MCSELTPGTDVMAVKTAENVSLKSLVTGWTGQDSANHHTKVCQDRLKDWALGDRLQ